jgi:hypothetical protein
MPYTYTSTTCIMLSSSWFIMWQWKTKRPVKSRNRERKVTRPLRGTITVSRQSGAAILTDFLAEQTAAHEANKQRAKAHYDSVVAEADATIKTLKDHVAREIAALEAAADAHA